MSPLLYSIYFFTNRKFIFEFQGLLRSMIHLPFPHPLWIVMCISSTQALSFKDCWLRLLGSNADSHIYTKVIADYTAHCMCKEIHQLIWIMQTVRFAACGCWEPPFHDFLSCLQVFTNILKSKIKCSSIEMLWRSCESQFRIQLLWRLLFLS